MIITFTQFWADISYETDHKFTRNTLELSSLLHKGAKLTHFSSTEYKLYWAIFVWYTEATACISKSI